MLSDAKIRAAKPQDKPYKLTDSHRLYLLVNPGGSKLWKWSYAYDGKQRTLHFGVQVIVLCESSWSQTSRSQNPDQQSNTRLTKFHCLNSQ